MKLKYIALFIAMMGVVSCSNDFEANDILPVSELPGYAAFDAPGSSVNVEAVTVTESDGTASFTVEVPAGTLSDVTVNFTYEGTAVEGVDFTIDGGSGGSGSMTIEPNQSDFQNTDRGDIVVNILEDGVFDETKELTFTLTSASNAEGDLAVGRGGTDFNKTASLTITNVDCDFSDFSGEYTYTTTDYFCDGDALTGTGTLSFLGVDDAGQGTFSFSDWSFGTYDACYGQGGDFASLNMTYCTGIVAVAGADSFDDAWFLNNIAVDGATLTFDYSNAYVGDNGETEFASVTLVRSDGSDWPPMMN